MVPVWGSHDLLGSIIYIYTMYKWNPSRETLRPSISSLAPSLACPSAQPSRNVSRISVLNKFRYKCAMHCAIYYETVCVGADLSSHYGESKRMVLFPDVHQLGLSAPVDIVIIRRYWGRR